MALSERELRILHELEQSLQTDRRRRLLTLRHSLRRVTPGGVVVVLLCLAPLLGLALVPLGVVLGGGPGLVLATSGACVLAVAGLRLGWVWQRRVGQRR